RRRTGLVLVPAGLGGPRLAGPARRRGGAAPRTARSRPAAHRRRAGLVARRASGGRRRRATPAPARGDEGAGPCLVGDDRAPRRGREFALPPARRLPPPRTGRPPVLVGRRTVPRTGVRRDGPQPHACRRAGGEGLSRASPPACRG